MRIWTINLKHLDSKRLVALWRETLLCKKGIEHLPHKYAYQNHPQSKIFQNHPKPLALINTYLWYVYEEAKFRGFNFDPSKIDMSLVDEDLKGIPVPKEQVLYEYKHLGRKINRTLDCCETNPLFYIEEVEWPFEVNKF